MEIDQQGESFEIQDQVKLMNSEEQSDGNKNNQSTARSYECTFCKRGFTNAQALGGHMNIHRKEKAKLKQSTSSSSSMVVDTLKMIPTTPARLTWVVPPTAAEGHDRDGDGENNPSFTLEETLIGEVRQLPLFVEKPSNMDQKLEIRQVPTSDFASDQKIGSSFQRDYVVSELDLELRLGPEPQNSTPTSSAPTGSTRHFF